MYTVACYNEYVVSTLSKLHRPHHYSEFYYYSVVQHSQITGFKAYYIFTTHCLIFLFAIITYESKTLLSLLSTQ